MEYASAVCAVVSEEGMMVRAVAVFQEEEKSS